MKWIIMWWIKCLGCKNSNDCANSWCRNSHRPSSGHGVIPPLPAASASPSSASSSASGGLSSSSYCRRLGSAVSTRRSSTFQLWSPRLRMRDERKRVLKLSLAKLRQIDDAESCLRRSVLLNNTLRRLQRDARDEKSGTTATATAAAAAGSDPAARIPMDVTAASEAGSLCSSRLHQASGGQSVLGLNDLDADEAPRAGIKRRRSSDVARIG